MHLESLNRTFFSSTSRAHMHGSWDEGFPGVVFPSSSSLFSFPFSAHSKTTQGWTRNEICYVTEVKYQSCCLPTSHPPYSPYDDGRRIPSDQCDVKVYNMCIFVNDCIRFECQSFWNPNMFASRSKPRYRYSRPPDPGSFTSFSPRSRSRLHHNDRYWYFGAIKCLCYY